MADTDVLFSEAIDAFRQRLEMAPAEWDALVREADASARQRATLMAEAMRRDLERAVAEAIEQGATIDAFRADYDRIVASYGWSGAGDAAWHSDLIFRRLSMESYAAGRWRQVERLKSRRPYLRYVTAGDARVREAHRAWHDVVLPVDDPWWRTHYPPNGWNCRCHVQSLSDRDLARYGLSVTAEAPPVNMVTKMVRTPGGIEAVEVPAGIDPGFAHNVGLVGLLN